MRWLRTQPRDLARARRSRPCVEVRRRACAWARSATRCSSSARTRRWRCTIATSRCGSPERAAALGDFDGLDDGRRPRAGRAVRSRRARRSTAPRAFDAAGALSERRLRGLRPSMSVTDAPRVTAAPFVPRRWLANGHVMTVFAWARARAVLRRCRRRRRGCFASRQTRRCSRTATGSRIASRRPTLLALHGLEGSSEAHYMRGLADKAWRRGWNAVLLNQRNCGGTEHLTPGPLPLRPHRRSARRHACAGRRRGPRDRSASSATRSAATSR